MAPDTGRHDADENHNDRARVDYLAGVDDVELDATDQAELDELRALLADPTLWSEPPAELEDSVVALIAAEAGATTSSAPSASPDSAAPTAPTASTASTAPTAGSSEPPPFRLQSVSTDRSEPDAPAAPTAPVTSSAPTTPSAPTDLSAARERKQRRKFSRPTLLIAAAAAVVAITVSGILLLRDSGQRRFDVALSATELAPGATGNAVMLKTDSGWEITLNATGLPRRENGEFYQAWLRNADGVLVPIGTFNEGTDVVLWGGVSPESFSTMTITLETADGDQNSSGQRVLVGTAVED
jgi:hypothetical protein